MHNYEELYDFFTLELENEIKATKKREPSNLYEPVIYTLNMGGKRIRPVLLLMAYELFKEDFSKAVPLAIAIEMFHNFTLLHDDIMDGAILRRNKKTIHVEYSENTAILSGDAMSILSYELLNRCKCRNYRSIFDLFTTTALQICEGQQYDMDFEKRNDVNVDEYLNMIKLKTAVLLAASLKMGALSADASLRDANLLYDFGYNLGMAFQLQDDYLDTFGTKESFGKNIGGDIVANKKTFLMLKALEMADERQKAKLQDLIASDKIDNIEKIEKVTSLYNELNIPAIVRIKMDEFYQRSIESLNNIDVKEYSKEKIKDIAGKMMKRKK